MVVKWAHKFLSKELSLYVVFPLIRRAQLREGGKTPFGLHLNFPEQMVWERMPWKSTYLLPQWFPPFLPLKISVENWFCGGEVVGGGCRRAAEEPEHRLNQCQAIQSSPQSPPEGLSPEHPSSIPKARPQALGLAQAPEPEASLQFNLDSRRPHSTGQVSYLPFELSFSLHPWDHGGDRVRKYDGKAVYHLCCFL